MLPAVASKLPKVDANKGAFSNNPFAALANQKALFEQAPKQVAPEPKNAARPPPARVAAPIKVRMRLETKGRSGKVVTRISGLPEENLAAIATQLARALGCGATLEQTEVLLQGSLMDRAQQWLDRAGDLRVIQSEPPRRVEAALPSAASSTPTRATGRVRSELRRGQRVAIVMKADQPTGKLTEGHVRDLLTNSEEHPRGIKVRLETGEIGRVRIVFD
jgi:uncharacterized repeat protein (TIGR03833 family)